MNKSLYSKQFIDWCRSASPYIRVHRGKTFVIQFDDEVIRSEAFTELVHDLALLNNLGIKLIIVYGDRYSIEKKLKKEGQESTFHMGMRVTDSDLIEYVKEVAGKLRVEIESKLSMGMGNTPMSNSDLIVSSGNYVIARPIGVVDGVDYQFTGEVRSIDIATITNKLDNNEIVLIPPVAYSTTGEAFNLSAYNLASKIAGAMGADKLIYLMEAEGIRDSDGELIRQMDGNDAVELLAAKNHDDDDYRYIEATVDAMNSGVQRVHLVDRRIDGAIIQELFTRDGAGTMASVTPYDVIRQAEISDISGILDIIVPLEKADVLVTRSREKLELEISYFTIMERDGVIIACAALYPFEEKYAEIACLAVKDEYARHGRGELLLEKLESEACEKNHTKLFILTTHAEHWFLDHGFENAEITDLPGEKKVLYNYKRNSKVLIKNL
jgi:amino-acid N-acetyltransferase